MYSETFEMASSKPGCFKRFNYSLVFAVVLIFITSPKVFAHGVAGARFFPSTLAIEDPFTDQQP